MGRRMTPDIDRFKKFIKMNPETQCWDWQGNKDKNGYGMFYTHSNLKNNRAHRWGYINFNGPIADGLTIDHLCRNKSCVNPAHLEPVTNKENILRAKRTINICRQGHPYTTENTYITSLGYRGCKQCRTARSLAFQLTPQGKAYKKEHKRKIKIISDGTGE